MTMTTAFLGVLRRSYVGILCVLTQLLLYCDLYLGVRVFSSNKSALTLFTSGVPTSWRTMSLRPSVKLLAQYMKYLSLTGQRIQDATLAHSKRKHACLLTTC